jgi:type IV pilus assembly protein PilW
MSAQACSSRQRGRTLLELMVAITIGFVVLGAILAVYLATAGTSRQSNSVARMSEDAAIAFSFIGNQIRMAGYSPPRVVVAAGTSVIRSGVSVAFPDRHFIGAAIRGCDNGFSSADNTAFANLACATSGGSAAFAVRYEADTDSTAGVTVSGVTYPSDCLNQAVTTTATSAYDGSNYPLVESRFSVRTDATSGNPELFCGGNGNSFAPLPVIQYVESMVVQYGVAANADSRDVVRYATATQVNALGGVDADANWRRVVSVKLCLVMRSETRDQTGPNNYADCTGTMVNVTDGFTRRAFSTVFALRNRSGF